MPQILTPAIDAAILPQSQLVLWAAGGQYRSGQPLASTVLTLAGLNINRTTDSRVELLDLTRTSGVAGFSGLGFGGGNYGFLDYDVNSANGVRLSALGPLLLGNNTNSAYGSETFTEAMRIASGAVSSIKFGNASNSANTATLDGYTDYIAYTPTFTGFGTVTGVSVWSARIGDTLYLRGKFTTGTATAVEARMTLGFNGTNANVNSDATKVASIQLAGPMVCSSPLAGGFHMLIESNVGYVTFGYTDAAQPGTTKTNGSVIAGTSRTFTFTAAIPISGW